MLFKHLRGSCQMKRISQLALLLLTSFGSHAQNPLLIPPLLEGQVFDLVVQPGITQFFPGINTPTFGVNGNILAPTLVLNKGETVTLNVTNNLSTSTTMHWHGLHVSAMNDGGPHQVIDEGATWSPQFEVMNNAGTFWYHPHGENKTDLQVSKGLAGMIIVRDNEEAAIELPRTYGVDDFPLVVQSKSFDVLNQIQIATHADTTVMVNATVDAFLDVPAQVVRFRLLDGASDRSFMFGFSNGMNFYQIATDGGLMEVPNETNRLRLSNGERAEILVDFSALQGQTIYLMSYSSELPDGIIGAENVGVMAEPEGYSDNPLNGADFNLLQINVVEPTADPINTIPVSLSTIVPLSVDDVDVERTINLAPQVMGMEGMVEGPFVMNDVQFNMEVINITCQLNNTELWTITNQTQVAHPFHIHDVEFQIVDFNGDNPPPDLAGWKDVVLVMPMQSVSFITKFEDFADPMTPYMYHCHLLHHEDEGMMGSFVVVDPNNVSQTQEQPFSVFPNPAQHGSAITISNSSEQFISAVIFDLSGKQIQSVLFTQGELTQVISLSSIAAGIYTLKLSSNKRSSTQKLVVQ